MAGEDEETRPDHPQGLVNPLAHVPDRRHGTPQEGVELTEDRDEIVLALLPDGGGEEHRSAPSVGELEDHPSRLPRAVDEEHVSTLLFLELLRQEGETLQVDGHGIDGVAVGEPLEGPEGDLHPPFCEFLLDLRELPVSQEPSLAHMSQEVEGVDALRRSDRVGFEDAARMSRAVERDLREREVTVHIGDGTGDGLEDMERATAVRGTGVLVRLPAEGPGIIRSGEYTAGGGGCRSG